MPGKYWALASAVLMILTVPARLSRFIVFGVTCDSISASIAPLSLERGRSKTVSKFDDYYLDARRLGGRFQLGQGYTAIGARWLGGGGRADTFDVAQR